MASEIKANKISPATGTTLTIGDSGDTISIAGTVSVFASGTKMLFAQTSAPTLWTKDTTHDNKALRVVSGTTGSGGSVSFSTAFASQAVSGSIGNTTAINNATTAGGTVGSTTLTVAQMPSHDHDVQGPAGHSLATKYGTYSGRFATFSFAPDSVNSGDTYGGRNWFAVAQGSTNSHNHSFSGSSHNHTQNAHNHSFTGTAINMAVQYVDVIIATKD
jgi:hypothetical protein